MSEDTNRVPVTSGGEAAADDPALSAPNYQPPTQTTTNVDIAALIQQAVQAQLSQALAQQQAAQLAAAQPKVLSPEEQARAALDNAGAGLGIEERLQELYQHLELIARKVGI